MTALRTTTEAVALPRPCPGALRQPGEIAADPGCRRCGRCKALVLEAAEWLAPVSRLKTFEQ